MLEDCREAPQAAARLLAAYAAPVTLIRISRGTWPKWQ
jgi:hypothetical protein